MVLMHSHQALPARLMENNFRVFRHAAFMGLILFFWFLFSFQRLSTAADVGRLVLYGSTYIAVAYLNMYYLFPRFLLRGRTGAYAGLSLASFLTSYLLQNLVYFKGCDALANDLTPSLPLLADIGINSITYCMFIGIGLSAKYIGKWIRSELRISALEKENLQAKLNSLRSQVSEGFTWLSF